MPSRTSPRSSRRRRPRERSQREAQPRPAVGPAERLDTRSSFGRRHHAPRAGSLRRLARRSSTLDRGHGLPGIPGQLRRLPRAAARQASHRTISCPARSSESTADDPPFPFFPDIYNEDWFFFSKAVARLDLANAGTPTQGPTSPSPTRAGPLTRSSATCSLKASSLIGEVLDRRHREGRRMLDYQASSSTTPRGAFWEDFIGARRATLTCNRDTVSSAWRGPPRRARQTTRWGRCEPPSTS